MVGARYIRRIIRLAAVFLLSATAQIEAHGADTSTRIFSPRFKTLQTRVADNFMAPPVIRMGTEDRIVVSFDEIGEDNSWLEYRLIHCNADWQPSRLVESEYLDCFNSQRIEDYAFSTNTYVHYVNYRVELPGEDCPILHSGNYLLQVYDPDAPDETLLQTRFKVSEQYVVPRGVYTSRTDRGHNTEWQQVEFTLDGEGFDWGNPYLDIDVRVQQNVDGLSERQIKAPMRVSGETLVYEHLDGLVYPAGNEYRRFESTSNGFAGMHVDSLRYMGSNYHVWLKHDEPRAGRQYSFDRTQHGRFIVREYNSTDSDIGADYITVHFTLDAPEYRGMDVYVDGEFAHNRYDDSNRMTYNRERGAYEAEIPLKQGAYNYRYVARPAGTDGTPSAEAFEGNFHETGNEYSVSVYYRPPGSRGDRLVGSAVIGEP